MWCGVVSSFERVCVVFFQTIQFAPKKGKNLLIACMSKIKAVEPPLQESKNGQIQA